MKKYIFTVLIFYIFTACSKNENGEAFNFVAGQSFYLLDKDGNDRLNPQSEMAINAKKIRIYYLVDGERMEAIEYLHMMAPNAILDNPYGFGIGAPSPISNRSYYSIDVGLNCKGNDGDILYTYIEWDENDTDTIRSEIYRKNSVLKSTIVAFNDSVWTPNQLENRTIFTIIKP
ncbi:hypothetical protein [Dysgonomonas macrotermitis]|uniref:Uncharacterized protein n=1 Tax=Dysgonomonas macrotermitis TaxID=1346286 RepID=A0A1M5C9N3_9BACT|nr:hypothetical protein [Dysgonomonas macrotermitis]SHF51366.1 hypothetical protein SAMN05444362_10782 [Dysgonomonas macrotermitis]